MFVGKKWTLDIDHWKLWTPHLLLFPTDRLPQTWPWQCRPHPCHTEGSWLVPHVLHGLASMRVSRYNKLGTVPPNALWFCYTYKLYDWTDDFSWYLNRFPDLATIRRVDPSLLMEQGQCDTCPLLKCRDSSWWVKKDDHSEGAAVTLMKERLDIRTANLPKWLQILLWKWWWFVKAKCTW